MHSVLINVPVSSPLHPQANLPFLKGFLSQNGFEARVVDANILFFNWFLAHHGAPAVPADLIERPLDLLNHYNGLEDALAERAKGYSGLRINLRGLSTRYDHSRFADVRRAVEDAESNPFIGFLEEFVEKELIERGIGLVGIALTFQDQVLAAFTLARILREKLPQAKIVMGGQMITRCRDTLLEDPTLNHLWDFLACYDGEWPLLDLHKQSDSPGAGPIPNVIGKGPGLETVSRSSHGFDLDTLDGPDFSDIDFSRYLFPGMLVPLQTARGCYATCEFCAIPMGSNIHFRERSIEKIVGDIERVQQLTAERYGKKATYFKFMDDTSSARTLLNLARELERRKIDAKWETFVRLDKPFESRDVMEQLYGGGCRKLMWGLETNDPDILRRMGKKINAASTGRVLSAAHHAGILNFTFVLVGYPGETADQRDRLADFIIENESIHVLTVATFDVTKGSPMHARYNPANPYGLHLEQPRGFEVRLPFTVNGENWKEKMVPEAHRLLLNVIRHRPDIGFMSLFPDQVRGMLCDRFGNDWGRRFLAEFGADRMTRLLLTTERYVEDFAHFDETDASFLPEPLVREHARTKEDIRAIARAIERRKDYETKRIAQL